MNYKSDSGFIINSIALCIQMYSNTQKQSGRIHTSLIITMINDKNNDSPYRACTM